MVDYFKAFDETYIPLKVDEGIEMFTEEIYDQFVDNYYQTLQFDKDFSRISQGMLEEDYKLLKEAAHSIKGGLGYLLPIVVDDVSNKLQIFILERIDGKDTKAKYPFTEEDKMKVYKDSLFVLTEMVALQRYLTKKYPLFENKYVYEIAKKLIDSCYQKYFDRFKLKKVPSGLEQSGKLLNNQSSTLTDKENKIQKSQQLQNDNSEKIKEPSIKQKANSDKDSKKESVHQEERLLTNGSVNEKSKNIDQSKSKDISNAQANNSNINTSANHNNNNDNNNKEEGVGNNDITIEQHETVQPCCNSCNIY